MARKSSRAKLLLTLEEVQLLDRLRQSSTAAWREVQRAQVVWRYYQGKNIPRTEVRSRTRATIMKAVRMTRKSVSKWISKALTIRMSAGIKDTPHGSPPVITEEAKAWVVHLACSKPKDLGYAAEVWSRHALAQHVRRDALAQGHSCLARASKATVQRILKAQPLQPHTGPRCAGSDYRFGGRKTRSAGNLQYRSRLTSWQNSGDTRLRAYP